MTHKIRIGDLGEIITGNTPPRDMPEYYGSCTPFIKATDIDESSKYTYAPEESYSEIGYQKYRKSLIPKGSTCVVTIGSIGKKMTMAHCDCFINQAMNAIIPSANYDCEYVYYVIKHNVHRLKALDSGTASGRENVSKSAFSNLEIDVIDDLEIQRKIGLVLSTYDDLIENNRRQVKLLEEAAQRLYKEWFVDLRFPGWETTPITDGVPEGWHMVALSEIASVNKQSISKQYPYDYIDYTDIGSVSMGWIKTTTRYATKDAPGRAKRIAFDGDILWGMVRPNLRSYALVFHPAETSVFSTGFAILHAEKVPFSFLYCHVTQDEFVGYLINCTNGAAYPAVKPIHFEKTNLLLPTDELLEKFHSLVGPMFRKVEILEREIHQATEARDRLLPKLMSGELEV